MVDDASRAPAERKAEAEKAAKAAAAGAPPPKRKVVSKRVTTKGGGRSSSTASKVGGHGKDQPGDFSSRRYTPPSPHEKPPSPPWVPVLMFGLMIVGALIIILNYVGLLGD